MELLWVTLDGSGSKPFSWFFLKLQTDNLECAEVLLAFRADPNALNRDGATPLDVASALRDRLRGIGLTCPLNTVWAN